jgi:hypothetical protein
LYTNVVLWFYNVRDACVGLFSTLPLSDLSLAPAGINRYTLSTQ